MPLWSPVKRVWESGGKVYNEDVIIIIPIAGTEVEGGRGVLWMQMGGKRGDEYGTAINWLQHMV